MSVELLHPRNNATVDRSFVAFGTLRAHDYAVWGVLKGTTSRGVQWIAPQSRPTIVPGADVSRWAIPFIQLPDLDGHFALEIYSSSSPATPIVTADCLRFNPEKLGLDIGYPVDNDQVTPSFWPYGFTGTPEDPIQCIKMRNADNEVGGTNVFVDFSGFWWAEFTNVPVGVGYTFSVSHGADPGAGSNCPTGGGQGDSTSPITVAN